VLRSFAVTGYDDGEQGLVDGYSTKSFEKRTLLEAMNVRFSKFLVSRCASVQVR
jgi:hypothetical protein